jgi:hypothetical protein
MDLYLSGMIMALSWVAATVFLQYWRKTGDRLFWLFSAAFFLFGLTRLRTFVVTDNFWSLSLFLARFVAFAIILAAIVDKNLRGAGQRTP